MPGGRSGVRGGHQQQQHQRHQQIQQHLHQPHQQNKYPRIIDELLVIHTDRFKEIDNMSLN